MKLIKNAPKIRTTFALAPAAEAEAAKLIAAADAVPAIVDDVTEAQAIAAGGAIRAHTNGVEKTRKELNVPADTYKRNINSIAATHNATLLPRLAGLEERLGRYRREKEQRAKLAEQERQAEQQRLVLEQNKAQEALQIAGGDIGAEIAAEQRQHAIAEQLAVVAVPLNPPKVAGIINARGWDWEVTDMKALYAARPDLVRLEPIGAVIRAVCSPEIAVPGLKMTWKDSVTIRAAR